MQHNALFPPAKDQLNKANPNQELLDQLLKQQLDFMDEQHHFLNTELDKMSNHPAYRSYHYQQDKNLKMAQLFSIYHAEGTRDFMATYRQVKNNLFGRLSNSEIANIETIVKKITKRLHSSDHALEWKNIGYGWNASNSKNVIALQNDIISLKSYVAAACLLAKQKCINGEQTIEKQEESKSRCILL